MKQQVRRNQPQSLTPQRRRIFIVILLLIPVLFFSLLEFSLRIFHYGPDLSLFTTEIVNGKSYYTLNPSVKNRYFSRINFNPGPSPEYFLVSKPPGTFRIFCLGGSTTVGYPYWYNGAFSSFLRDRLNILFHDRSIEIINVGMTATNSYTVLDLSKELIQYDPDLFIVYDGHNEFYGALGVASNDRVAPARWMTILYLQMVHLRTFQLTKNIISELFTLFGRPPIDYSNRTTIMEQVSRGKNVRMGSDTYNHGLTIFQQNLKDLSELCQSRHIPLFLSTQVSNLRNQSPFISNNSPDISERQKKQFQQLYTRGVELQSKNLIDSALISFRLAVTLDTLYADAHYRLAQCLDRKGKGNEALLEYILARDYDELRFRTDSKFNNFIRSMGDHKHCFIADIEKVFKSHSQDSLIGYNLIIEHLHPNAWGHFFIAKEYARMMQECGLIASTREWAKRDTISDDFLWEHRPLTYIDEFLAARKTEFLISGWPFKNQSSTVAPIEEKDTLRFIGEQAARNQIGWITAHRSAADYYILHNDFINAGKEYETIINQFPLDVTNYLLCAQLYFSHKLFFNAENILLASLYVQQTSVAYRGLGDIYMNRGMAEKAIQYYEESIKFPVDPAVVAENSYMLALAYLIAQKPEPAILILERTINQYPAYKPAKELLARVKLFQQARPAP